MDIQNKIIVITGASEGIGRATAKVLAGKGATVVLAARSADKLRVLAEELPNALAVPTDMRNPDDIRDLIATALDKFGRIDVLVNNAGQGMYGPVEDIDIDAYKDIVELNVYGPLRAMEMVIPVMRKQGGGMILNVSSKVSKNYFPNLAAYASTKYALNALSLTARVELVKDNIIVSVMHPKMTATNFGKNSVRVSPQPYFADRPNMEIDPPEAVAEKIAKLIESEEAEAEM
jgi:short-subunit dehydrogenase